MKRNIAIYIHWPFCKSKCPYCDFNSHVREKIDQQRWNEAYLKEISNHKEFLSGKKIVSIFFGGGTPSLMPSFIVESIIQNLSKHATIDNQVEITLEANPTSVESKKFKEFARAGINRVSLGIQSLNPDDLKFLGREHSAKEAIGAIEIAKENFARYSFDLIYALPKQTLKSWEQELTKALKLAGKHLSLYQLTIEKGTPFYSLYQNKKFQMPNEELAKDFYCLTQDIMEGVGLPAYEISNHAKEGQECRHNLVYWQYDDFLGIGPGAHSRINNKAIHSIYHPENWLDAVLNDKKIYQSSIELTEKEKICEILLMGLRLHKGINHLEFVNKTGYSFFDALNKQKLEFLLENNFLKLECDYLKTTNKGRLVLNNIINQLTET
jgi:putative oxygen-independent coproporphyrinogen III oxidase